MPKLLITENWIAKEFARRLWKPTSITVRGGWPEATVCAHPELPQVPPVQIEIPQRLTGAWDSLEPVLRYIRYRVSLMRGTDG